ncbi:hypothetical protein [Dolichospermum phage Dfl-JY45]
MKRNLVTRLAASWGMQFFHRVWSREGNLQVRNIVVDVSIPLLATIMIAAGLGEREVTEGSQILRLTAQLHNDLQLFVLAAFLGGCVLALRSIVGVSLALLHGPRRVDESSTRE